MDLNAFAKKVAEKEGLKKQLSIAQIKEVLKIVRKEVNDLSGVDIYAVIKKGK